MRHKAEWRPGSGEVGCAVTEYNGVKVNSVLVDQAEVREASRQVWTGNLNLPVALGLQPPNRAESENPETITLLMATSFPYVLCKQL
jgi:hypothetical protein